MRAIVKLILVMYMLLPCVVEGAKGRSGTVRLKLTEKQSPPDLGLTAEFRDPSANKFLDAGERAEIRLNISNAGQGTAYGVEATLSADDGRLLDFKRKIAVGDIQAGETKTVAFAIAADDSIDTRNMTFEIQVLEGFGMDADPVRMALSTLAFQPPRVEMVDFGIRDLSGDMRIEAKEAIDVTARIQNVGTGRAGGVTATIRYEGGDDQIQFIESSRVFRIGELASGAYKDVKFSFLMTPRFTGTDIPLSIEISEDMERYGGTFPLALKMDAVQNPFHNLVVSTVPAGATGSVQVSTLEKVLVDTEIPNTSMSNPDGVAVIIGNRNYTTQDVPSVLYAHRDARIMKEYLIRALGFREGNILFKENATKAELEALFGNEQTHKGRVFDLVKPGKSELFVFYSGHGAPDPQSREGYLVPVDADPNQIALSGFSLATLYRNLSKIEAAKITLVLDACYSGGSEKGMLLADISPVGIKIKNPLKARENTFIFTSASPGEVSTWYPDKQHSLFTYFFLKGMQGSADRDQNGIITYGEMADYVADRTQGVPYMARRLKGRDQFPQFIALQRDVEFLVLR